MFALSLRGEINCEYLSGPFGSTTESWSRVLLSANDRLLAASALSGGAQAERHCSDGAVRHSLVSSGGSGQGVSLLTHATTCLELWSPWKEMLVM